MLPFDIDKIGASRNSTPSGFQNIDSERVKLLYDTLTSKLGGALTVHDLQRWLIGWGEISAGIEQDGAIRHIAMTCNTEDPGSEQAYLQFVSEIEPEAKSNYFLLANKFLRHPAAAELENCGYEVFFRRLRQLVELHRESNLPLEVEDAHLGQKYQKLSGSLTATYNGTQLTLPQLGKFLEDPDREVRTSAWHCLAATRLSVGEECEELFDAMLKLRHQIALNAGYTNYLDYAFKLRGRFDYSVQDCVRFHEVVEKAVIPLLITLQRQRTNLLRLDTLRPWDLAVDLENNSPLRPFSRVADLLHGTSEILNSIDPQMKSDLLKLAEFRLLDLENRKGKAPGGYQTTLSVLRMPFIFMNAVGIQRDVETLLHEFGHALHTLAAANQELHDYRSAPIEFCEVASMSMELLGSEFLHQFYQRSELRRARRNFFEGILSVLPWIATIDAFQHWIYTHPSHSREERKDAWKRIYHRFQGQVDWTGLEQNLGVLWHKQLHVFLYPFYYIEYGIAQIGALQIWDRFKTNPQRTIQEFRHSLSLGGSRTLPALFHAAGIKFDFSLEILKPIIERIEQEINDLS